MGAATDYLENKILDHILGNVSYSAPATLYVGLATGVADNGTITGEPTTGSYARVAVTNNTINFPSAAGGTKSNGTEITFPEATGDWGTITHAFIADAATGGNVLLYSTLSIAKTITSGDTGSFPAGTLTFTLD